MGLTCSSATQGLSFHPLCRGSNISLNSCFHKATRFHSFHDGLVFSNRPLFPREKIWIKVLEVEQRWHGALRVGFTARNPSDIDANSLPPFACPNLTVKNGFWAVGIPEELCTKGAELCFWVNRKGQALCKVRGKFQPKLLFSGIPRRTRLWSMLDVYGQTKAIQLLDDRSKCLDPPFTHHQNKGPHDMGPGNNVMPVTLDKTSESSQSSGNRMPVSDLDLETMNLSLFKEDDSSCVICQDRIADTLLLPCRHCSFCKSCVLQIKRQSNVCPLCRQNILSMQDVGEITLLTNKGS